MRIVRRPGTSHRDPADRGSMPLAMLLTTVVMTLGVVMVPVVVRQTHSTATVAIRSSAIEASQSGMDAALGQLRAAGNDFRKLPPCELDGGADDRYHVTIKYYGMVAGATKDLGCPPSDVPVTAQLTVTGTSGPNAGQDEKNTRTLQATYTFRTTNENISGGNIRLDQPTSPYLCMDAGSTRKPAAGAAVTMEECYRTRDSTGKLVYTVSSDQRFAYNESLNIKLVKSESPAAPDGMCLDAPMPRTSGDTVVFKPCLGRVARQQWSLDNSSNFRSTSDGINLDSFCLNLSPAGTAGGKLVIGGCGGTANQRVFRPQAAVGAGMASSATGQLINFKQFSRCLDVTNHDVNMSYMIVWFCKQAPNGDVSWNQRWTLPPLAVGQAAATAERIRTTGTSSPGVCLRSPRTTVATKHVTVTACPATGVLTDESLKWRMYGDTGAYATSYTVLDVDGNCLTPTDLTVSSPDTHGDGTAKAKVARCDGSLLQKWNAPANLTNPNTLSNTVEK